MDTDREGFPERVVAPPGEGGDGREDAPGERKDLPHERDVASGGPGRTGTRADKLRELEEAHRSGALSDERFEEEKARLERLPRDD